MYQMFLTVRGAVQGSFRTALGVASLSLFMSSYDQDGELGDVPPPPPPTPRFYLFFFPLVLI